MDLLALRKELIEAAVAVETARGSDPTLQDLFDRLDSATTAYANALKGGK